MKALDRKKFHYPPTRAYGVITQQNNINLTIMTTLNFVPDQNTSTPTVKYFPST